MTQPIFDSMEFYYLTLRSNDHQYRGLESPLGRGLKIIELPDEGVWGYATWLDLFGGQIRTISIAKAPDLKDDKNIIVISAENHIQYQFQQLNKEIYESHLRKKLHGPHVHNETELLEYLKNLNPFE